jgi:plastocyanin
MKYRFIRTLSVFLVVFSFFQSCAPVQKDQLSQVENIKLTQMPGVFTTQSLALAPGDYQFEIENDGVDHEVGFVLVPKGKYDEANHIKAAYVEAPAATGKSSLTSVVTLEAGEYEYFCPMNPTEKYPLTVGIPENIKLTQIPGEFKTESLTLEEGTYQFEIENEGVDHEVGFVLVPKGKYDAANHIKAAYVIAPAATGKSSMTNIVSLKTGEYEYFCPLNPTEKYSLTVGTPESIKLTQVPGKFETESLIVKEGTYQFEIENKGVDHEVGFVLVPKGKYDAANHIKAAYVSAPVATGKSSLTSFVSLEAGEYEYFCPLNPTEKYPLTVSDKVKSIKLTQIPGEFETESLSLKAGQYQFEIANKGVNHEVGFVLVPKGKYDATNHIKAAYVKAPVPTGKSSLTSVVSLEAGEYEYFCPLNPTDKYALTIE